MAEPTRNVRKFTLGALLVAATACEAKAPPPAPAASVSSAPPAVVASAAPASAAPAAHIDEPALLALHAKYEAPAKALAAAMLAAIAEEKKKPENKRRSRIPLPASSFAKDPDVLEVDTYTQDTVDVASLNGLPRAGASTAIHVPSGAVEFKDQKARCVSEYTTEPAADLTYSDGWQLIVVVRTNACLPVTARRDAGALRAKTIAEPLLTDILARAATVPARCEKPSTQPEPAAALARAGFVGARLSCRNPDERMWKWDVAHELEHSHLGSVVDGAWMPAVPGFAHVALFVEVDKASNKALTLYFEGIRNDRVEIKLELYPD